MWIHAWFVCAQSMDFLHALTDLTVHNVVGYPAQGPPAGYPGAPAPAGGYQQQQAPSQGTLLFCFVICFIVKVMHFELVCMCCSFEPAWR